MSELVANKLKSFIHSQLGAERLSDIIIGTVTNTDELEITIDKTQLPLRSVHLLVPQQFSIFELNIIGGDLFLRPDNNDSDIEEKIDTTIKVDNRLKVGDKVVMLSFQQDQKFLVIDRLKNAFTE